MSRPFATVSVDVDPIDLHLAGYGYRDLAPDPKVYATAIPRLLEILDRAGIAATFFLVGRDAASNAAAIASISRAGHEVASHSFSHPFAFASMPRETIRRELLESRRLLEETGGSPVAGFRSPNFHMNADVLGMLAEAGYRYDASGYPTPFLAAARLLLALKSRDFASTARLGLVPFTLRRRPYRWTSGGRRLHEFPVSVTPGIRFPVYHTARYLWSDDRFVKILSALAGRGDELSYPLHAVDVLGLSEDGVDPRLARHPGMKRPLGDKLELLERSLEAIAARFEPATFRARLDRMERG